MPNKAWQILVDLGFLVEENNSGSVAENEKLVKIPSHRHDISLNSDLVEEVIRIFGYDKITKKVLSQTNGQNEFKNSESFTVARARNYLAEQGMIETINWSFVDVNMVEIFAEKNSQLILKNPISVELNHMRPNLLIGLLASYKKNALRNFSNLSLFEIGNVFLSSAIEGQKLMISGIRAGKNVEQNHYHNQRDFDVFDVKKDFFDVAEIFGMRPESLQMDASQAPKYYHPHRCVALKLGKNLVGYFGEIHPAITKKFDIKNRINAFEIFVDALPNNLTKTNLRKAFVVNDFPLVERDFAFLVKRDLAINDIVKTISNCDKQLIKEVSIFDIFTGENIANDKKSVALRVKIQPIEKTLTSEEIEAVSKKIIEAVAKFYGATLRE
jgi:phenylalanyl-tRNA synthetase beta chain